MSSSRVHDPLFHFETHFPERLSRLHLNPEFGPVSPNRKNKRSRTARQGVRYKTQPVTFDEITEVDEETTPNTEPENTLDQLQAFSRSMDGLLPKLPGKKTNNNNNDVTSSGKRFAQSTVATQTTVNENRLQGNDITNSNDKEDKENCPEPKLDPASLTALPPTGLPTGKQDGRRQKLTAKAKRRQMMEAGKDGTKES
ncbi:hypothetical protein KP79_PYT06609 [Mizuhopecten yessoensis]|uniref:Uncharacterized protein n=1 Tax=Mizuhopecten yessoensis TaxID=6573 RepID=A0A210R1E1_MIZYE|nr:hypothetical protein KP79_PYT06609 [Mizuhopecten yessoensis]